MKISNSSLITILSAAGVGLVKSQMGSSARKTFDEIELEIQFNAPFSLAYQGDLQLIDPGDETKFFFDEVFALCEGNRQDRLIRGEEHEQEIIENFLYPLHPQTRINFSNFKTFFKEITVTSKQDKINNDRLFWKFANKLLKKDFGGTVEQVLQRINISKEGFEYSIKDWDTKETTFHFNPFTPHSFEDYLGNTNRSFESFCENFIKWGLSDSFYHEYETWMKTQKAFVFLLNEKDFGPSPNFFREIVTVKAKINLLETWSKKEKLTFIKEAIDLLKTPALFEADLYWGSNMADHVRMNYTKTTPTMEEITDGVMYRKILKPRLRRR